MSELIAPPRIAVRRHHQFTLTEAFTGDSTMTWRVELVTHKNGAGPKRHVVAEFAPALWNEAVALAHKLSSRAQRNYLAKAREELDAYQNGVADDC